MAVHAQRINHRTNVCNTRYDKVAKVFAYNVKPKNIIMCKTLIAYNVRALCRCGISIPSARNRCPAFDKDKYLEPLFGDVGQARTNAAMLLMMIAAT